MLSVYTAITGNFEPLQSPQFEPDPWGRAVQLVAFTHERIGRTATGWEIRPPVYDCDDPRRAARWHKTHPQLLFPAARFSLWHDGSHALTVNPWELVDKYLIDPRHPHAAPACDYTGDADLATFRHPQRATVAEELLACARLGKDNVKLMQAQVHRYRAEGFPDDRGLFETAAVLRRHTPEVAAFDARWWHEIDGGSVRDQLSIGYALWRCPVRVAILPGRRDASPFFRYVRHR